MSKYIKQADIGEGGFCHLFRHIVATLMLDSGADIRFIQQMLGHLSTGTTEIYTHVSIGKRKQIHDITHPTMHKRQAEEGEPEAAEDDPLAALEDEANDE